MYKRQDALKTERDEIDENEWKEIQKVIDEALENIANFRKDEGVSLEKEFLHRIATVSYTHLDVYKRQAFTFVKWIYTFGFMMVLPFGWSEFHAINWTTIPTDIYWKIGFVVVFSTFLTYLLNLVSMRELKPTTVAVFIYLQPLFATIFAVGLGKDELSLVKLLSVVLVFAGVYLVTQKE